MSFTQSNVINYSKEREWASNLGMLDWDSTNIVFTKRSLIEFLKYTGTTVDTNFSNIQKLPKYATFGTFEPSLPKPLEVQTDSATQNTEAANNDDFKPTRRVRQVPGGPHTDIFGSDFQSDNDALSTAPPIGSEVTSNANTNNEADQVNEDEQGIAFSSKPMPSRRVRENPGGNSSLSTHFWEAEAEEFKPTRRVRQAPGGQDHIF